MPWSWQSYGSMGESGAETAARRSGIFTKFVGIARKVIVLELPYFARLLRIEYPLRLVRPKESIFG